MRLVKFLIKRNVDTAKPIYKTSKKISIMGKTYAFKIIAGARNRVKICENHLEVTLNPTTKSNFETYIQSWYRRQARAQFYKSVDRWLGDFDRLEYTIPYPQLKLFTMRRAWGRCYYTKGVITVNLRLFSMPQECIDYIMLHELTHFVAHDHGPLFHAILDKIDPLWRKKEGQLRQLETVLAKS